MTGPLLKPSPVLLMVLALLSERPMHPYEMQRIVLERGKQAVITIKRGSIYHAVERLEAAGFVEQLETSRAGRRPERTVYQLTEEGRDEARQWMLLMLTSPKEEFPEFATVVSFLPVLEPHEVFGALQRRLVLIDGVIGRVEGTLRSVRDKLPRVFIIEEEYQLAMLQAERAWVAAVVDDFATGRLTWRWEDFAQYAGNQFGPPPPAAPTRPPSGSTDAP